MGIRLCVSKPKPKNRMKTEKDLRSANSDYYDRLSISQISYMQKMYQHVKRKEGVDFKGFKQLIPTLNSIPEPLQQAAFILFDMDSSGIITWQQLCLGISKYILGNRAEKEYFMFRLFDRENKGVLSMKQLKLLIKYTQNCLKEEGEMTEIEGNSELNFQSFSTWANENLDLNKAMEPFELIPSPVSERKTVQQLMNGRKYIVGESWNIISAEWMEAWKKYVNYESNHSALHKQSTVMLFEYKPIEINNSDLVDSDNNLIDTLELGVDFEVIPAEVWSVLSSWYCGGPELPRKIIQENEAVSVELYPPVFKIYIPKYLKVPEVIMLSKKTYVSAIIGILLEKYDYLGQDGKLYWMQGDYLKQLNVD